MKLRAFNDAGIQAFRNYLDRCRSEPTLTPPTELLEDDALSQPISPMIEVEPRAFGTKEDAARYLTERLAVLPEPAVDRNVGLWSWLTLFYFDSVVPARDGRRVVRNEYYYIVDLDSRYVYRHLLRVAWLILKVAPTHNRLMLTTPVSILDKVSERTMARLYLSRIPCFFEVIDRLYWDPKRGRSKVGIANPNSKAKPGDLDNRLPMRIRQLEMTYDTQSLAADQLIELLGSEFEPWLRPAGN